MFDVNKILEEIEEVENSAFFFTPPVYEHSKSYIFKRPASVFYFDLNQDCSKYLEELENARENGLIGYGMISYEFGYLLEEKLRKLLPHQFEFPLVKFCFFEPGQVQEINSLDISFRSAAGYLDPKKYEVNNFKLNTSKEKYIKDILKVRGYIGQGDTYQVNYTVKGKFDFRGDPKSLFLNFIFNQSAEYSAFINSDEHYIISASPELFFTQSGKEFCTKPMKGTIGRGLTELEDLQKYNQLQNSSKDRAENVMIVDLLRNDMGRVSEFGSVKVESLFDIKKYESLFQMTSTINSKLKNKSLKEILRNIFPCGSITGAPKIRTMEIIHELEKEPRNIYTGAIGIVKSDSSIFNVAIRTVKLDKHTGKGEIGIGAGIVWDSEPEKEYTETLLKGKFLTHPEEYFEIFETLLFEKGDWFLLETHIERMKKAADYFLFYFEEEKLKNKIYELELLLDKSKDYKVRVSLDKWGNLKPDYSILETEKEFVKIRFSSLRVRGDNKYLYHKTSNRMFYTGELASAKTDGFFEVVFLNEEEQITEGAFTNIFIKKDGLWYTPPVKCGLLNGCYRQYLLQKDDHLEKILSVKDITEAEAVKIINSVRKEIIVDSIEAKEGFIYKS